MNIGVLIADDHRIMREGIRSMLEKENDMKFLAAAEDGRNVVRLARELDPDVIIMDDCSVVRNVGCGAHSGYGRE